MPNHSLSFQQGVCFRHRREDRERHRRAKARQGPILLHYALPPGCLDVVLSKSQQLKANSDRSVHVSIYTLIA